MLSFPAPGRSPSTLLEPSGRARPDLIRELILLWVSDCLGQVVTADPEYFVETVWVTFWPSNPICLRGSVNPFLLGFYNTFFGTSKKPPSPSSGLHGQCWDPGPRACSTWWGYLQFVNLMQTIFPHGTDYFPQCPWFLVFPSSPLHFEISWGIKTELFGFQGCLEGDDELTTVVIHHFFPANPVQGGQDLAASWKDATYI